MFDLIDTIRRKDPAKPTFWEVVLAYPGFHVLGFYICAHKLWSMDLRALARFISHLGRVCTGIEIHPGATLGKRLFIDHGMGVVIGETAVVGDDVTIYHGVTLGGRGAENETGKRHPTLGDHVMIGSGAQVLGNITIGDRGRVGANAVLTRDVPEGCTAVGNPARLVNCKDAEMPGAYGLPAEENPDPVGETIGKLLVDVHKLKQQIASANGEGPAADEGETASSSESANDQEDEAIRRWMGDSI